MTDLTRRHFVASAAGVAALGLSGSVAFLSPAEAADVRKKGFYKYKVGSDIEVISLYDGVWQKAHDPNFIIGADVDATKAALRKAGETD
ncbi:MAG: MBL fold metallo-hydrolase, partial [Pseudomonadota bacterium]